MTRTVFSASVFSHNKENKDSRRSNAPRLLLIEDDPLVLRLHKRMLDRDYQVTVTGNGFEAINLIKKHGYDVVLVDLRLPDISGFEVIRHVREVLGLEIPIIAITAYDGEVERAEAIQSGANVIIGKPVLEEELRGLLMHYTG